MFTIVGKYFLHGVYQTGEPYEFYRIYCTVFPSDDEKSHGFEGLKTKAFNFSRDLFYKVVVGDSFIEPLFNDARMERDKVVRYLVKE